MANHRNQPSLFLSSSSRMKKVKKREERKERREREREKKGKENRECTCVCACFLKAWTFHPRIALIGSVSEGIVDGRGPGSPSFLSTQHQLTPSPSPLQSRDYHFIGSDLRALYTNPNSMGGLHLPCQACLVPLSTILATGHQVARVRGCHTSSGMSNEVVVCIVEDLLFIFFSFRSFFARVIQTIWKCTCAENVSRWKSTVVWLILRCERSVFVGTIKRRKIMETMFRIEIEEKGILERKEERERERLIVWKFFKRQERLKFPINRTSFFFVRFKIVALLDALRRCFNKINVYGWQWTGSSHED